MFVCPCAQFGEGEGSKESDKGDSFTSLINFVVPIPRHDNKAHINLLEWRGLERSNQGFQFRPATDDISGCGEVSVAGCKIKLLSICL